MQKSSIKKQLQSLHSIEKKLESTSSTSSSSLEIEMSFKSNKNSNKTNNTSSEKQPLILSGSHLQRNNDDDHCDHHGHSHQDDHHGHSHDHDDHHNHNHDGDLGHHDPIPDGKNSTPNIPMTEEELQKHIRAKTSLIIAIVFCVIFMIVELVSGILAHSLAIMTDAAHMLTDVGSLALALFAVIASQWQASEQFTFGFKRAEVVGALFSIMLVWGLVGIIIYEGVFRCIEIISCARGTQSQYTECEGTEPRLMLIVGCLGLVVNIGYAVILAWGGAEVKHAHSHGGDGDDDHHGHSHGGGGHGHGKKPSATASVTSSSASSHGHSHDAGGCSGGHHHDDEEGPAPIKCCEPTPEELECENQKCGHEHQKNNNSSKTKDQRTPAVANYSSIDSGESQVSLKNLSNKNNSCSHDDHDHDHHGHSHDDHHGNEHEEAKQKESSSSSSSSFTDALFGENANMNIRGAAVHALGDCLQSVGVIIAAGVIWGGCGVDGDAHSYYNIADPACSLMFAFITLWTTKSLFVEVFGILMERAPRGLHVSCIKKKLAHYPAVVEVKDVFIWSISNDRTALGAHCVVKRNATTDEIFDTLDRARTLCAQLGFSISAIEVLREGDDSTINYKTLSGASPLASPPLSPTHHGHSH